MNRRNFDFDSITVMLYLVLVILGWMTIYAVSSATGSELIYALSEIHGRQLLWIGISVVAGLLVVAMDSRFIEAASYYLYGFAILMLVFVLFNGVEVNGARSWISIGGQRFQPSEFAKLATAMALAKYMSSHNFNFSNARQVLIASMLFIVPAVIVIFQNDTGSALVFFSFLIVFYREGLNPIVPMIVALFAGVAVATLGIGNVVAVIGGLVGIAIVSFLFFYQKRKWVPILGVHIVMLGICVGIAMGVPELVKKLPQHQQNRIMVLFDPQIDPLNTGYNVIQSKIAIASGGVAGKGYLEGNYTKYRFVPKQETDFIYCTIGEEFGWIGTAGVLILFMALIMRLRFMAENSKTQYARIYGYGLLSIIFFHVLVNVGMTIGLVPVIGIPLPFFSYGGSSLLNFTLLIAIMVNLFSHRVSILGSSN